MHLLRFTMTGSSRDTSPFLPPLSPSTLRVPHLQPTSPTTHTPPLLSPLLLTLGLTPSLARRPFPHILDSACHTPPQGTLLAWSPGTTVHIGSTHFHGYPPGKWAQRASSVRVQPTKGHICGRRNRCKLCPWAFGWEVIIPDPLPHILALCPHELKMKRPFRTLRLCSRFSPCGKDGVGRTDSDEGHGAPKWCIENVFPSRNWHSSTSRQLSVLALWKVFVISFT